ncbi:MAG: MoaD/ThiS family protein [Bacillota bacterium]|jgi:molybdopterin converting factor small subunit
MPIVRVWTAGGLTPCKHTGKDEVVLEPKSTLRDLFKVLGLSPGPGVVVLVDGRRIELDDLLPDGCEVTVFPHVAGGA